MPRQTQMPSNRRGRKVQTCRKCSGARAPRSNLARPRSYYTPAYDYSSDSSWTSSAEEKEDPVPIPRTTQNKSKARSQHYHGSTEGGIQQTPRGQTAQQEEVTMIPSQDARERDEAISQLEIHLSFCMNSDKAVTHISDLDEFDFDNAALMAEFQAGFKVRRQPVLGNMDAWQKEYLNDVLNKAKKLHPDSAYIVLQDCEEFDDAFGVIISEARDPACVRKQVLPDMLDSGNLYGCVLKGSKEMGQFGLVATENLAQWTPIVVDCGMIWSEELHDSWLEEIGNKMPAMSSTSIPANTFECLFAPSTWHRKYKKKTQDRSFVVDCFETGNEVKHLDDAGWILAHEGENACRANVDSFAVLSLKNNYLSVVYCANRDVQKGMCSS